MIGCTGYYYTRFVGPLYVVAAEVLKVIPCFKMAAGGSRFV